jgi:3-oxoacyl-[acyl-carrier protein] reductase
VHFRERKDEAASVAASVESVGGEAVCYQADIRKAHQVTTMVRNLVHHWGHLDVMICNAGIASSRLLLRLSPEEWASVIETNLTGTFHCLQAVGQHMLERGQGTVIIIGSFAGIHGQPGQAAYAASKAGLLGLIKTAAREWGPSNVRVNAVFPGRHSTELAATSQSHPVGTDAHVLCRTPDLSEVARSVYQLALMRDASGQVWNLDSRIF